MAPNGQSEELDQGKVEPRAIRLTFSYEGKNVKLLSQQKVSMLPPPSDTLKYNKKSTGFWYEIHDSSGLPIFRRVVHNPIQQAVEVRSDDRDRPLTWQEVKKASGQFVLMIPDLDKAAHLVLFSSPLEIKRSSQPAKPMAQFPLGKPRNRKGAK